MSSGRRSRRASHCGTRPSRRTQRRPTRRSRRCSTATSPTPSWTSRTATDIPPVAGRELIRRFVAGTRGALAGVRFEALDFIDAGPDAIVMPTAVQARGASSDAEVRMDFAYLFRFTERGTVAEMVTYRTVEEALAAAAP